MIQQIRNSKVSKVIATYLALMIFIESTQPIMMFALTEGPSQPEFNSFTPIGTSDMVDLASGDLNYNIPIMDVGGYPLNLAYSSGVTMDQEASWVGLGWDLSVGQIARNMRGLPDDFNGDPMVYENNMKPNITVGANVGVFGAALGIKELPIKFDGGIGIKYNNYDGFGSSINGGLTYQINDHMTLGMQMEASDGDGVSVSPSLSYHSKRAKNDKQNVELSGSLGVNYNSRKGIESFTFAASREKKTNKAGKGKGVDEAGNTNRTSVDVSQPYGVNGSVSFQDASFTPSKRVGMVASNFLFNLNLEGEIWGIEPGVKFSGFYAKQGIADSEKVKVERGFGYENTASATSNDVTDFNREKDRTVNRNTTTLPVSNYTYDLYSIQGQGVSGMFRPYRSQVGFLFDKYVEDTSNGGSLGGEVGGGGGAHFGLNATLSHGFSSTGLWGGNNQALPRLYENNSGTKLDYERVYFKNIGGNQVDIDKSLFDNTLKGYSPIKFGIAGGEYNRSTTANYVGTNPSSGVIRRDNRVNRNQTIQMLTVKEAAKYGTKSGQKSTYSKQHHTGEIRITKEGGTRYVYGKALYNTLKKEVTFDATGNEFNNITGLVSYSAQDASANNDKKGDQYFNRITTPAYAHTYLLTSVLSSDYQDLKDDGLTDDDLGSYTKFIYKNTDKLYKWRVPFDLGKANFDEGLKSLEKDNKGNYQYGEKELTYIQKIVTKTHVAVFESSPRKDSFGVLGEQGGLGADSQMYKLNTIKLYSKPEYDASPDNATPIKTAHFVYNYDLCKGIKNNSGSQALDAIETSNSGGKLTLQKVYFTYKNSKMGEYTPYTFQYSSQNPNYDMKAYDVWGYYKPKADNLEAELGMAGGGLSNTEYPFVDQNKSTADNYATAWHLSTINLPSGGKMNLDYESDDYKHVQDKEAMQMFKVEGMSSTPTPLASTDRNSMYSIFDRHKYMYIEVPEKTDGHITNEIDIDNKYIKNLRNQEMYFRFLLNMDQYKTVYDYVTGYAKIGTERRVFTANGKTYASIEIEQAQLGDGVYNIQPVNPISKAGWIFARQNLNRIAYGLGGNEENKSVKAIIMDVLGTAQAIFQIFSSPNGLLKTKGIADTFIPNKSWVRLMCPEQQKLGGGSRVKQVSLVDNWKVMTDNETDDNYNQTYGQQYTYKETNGNSSGVATYEPLGCKENPLVKPFYDNREGSGLLLGGESENYIEEPLGESFFPASKITYRRVEVKNLPRKEGKGATEKIVKKHATGTVVTEFFTTKDYPTIATKTEITTVYDATPFFFSALFATTKKHITMSQGFAVHTNDMDGKMRSQRVYQEGNKVNAISGVDYNYYNQSNNGGSGLLKNEITTINSKGKIEKNIVGVDYDVVNDFRQNESFNEINGAHLNFAILPTPPPIFLFLPTPLPTHIANQDLLKTAVTTKVIHSCGILRETVAYDNNSKVSTENLAWDAETGNVLLTKTSNEFNDNYYNFNYPAYWNQDYKNMGQASKNLNLVSNIVAIDARTGLYQLTSNQASKYLTNGDEIWYNPNKATELNDPENNTPTPAKAWVVNVTANSFNLIAANGVKVNYNKLIDGTFKIIKSGYKNNQMDNMASVTSMTNPLSTAVAGYLKPNLFDTTEADYKIVNASAIEYKDEWAGQCEGNLPKMVFKDLPNDKDLKFQYDENNDKLDGDDLIRASYNPYLYNIKGNWRPVKSYAYLTGRTTGTTTTDPKTRNTGFFKEFNPFYKLDINGNWSINPPYYILNSISGKLEKNPNNKWTFASEVAKYNPYGQEVENKDALDRFSSAQYGYNYKFPLAVSSNSEYREMGYDGFEDYNTVLTKKTAHFNFMEILEAYKNNNAVILSTIQAHSGRKSIRVQPNAKATLSKKLVTCTGTN